MQEIVKKNENTDWSTEDKQKLVEVFAWLIQEDKKQNPNLYKLAKEQEND
jgi:hypothetical protein